MSGLSTEVLYRKIADAKQICSAFTFEAVDVKGNGPGYAGECGFISFTTDGIFTVKPGYVFDGASGPTIDTDDCICAALGHDVMYELMDQGKLATHIYKDIADLWFYKRLQADGMLQYRAWAWFRAVSIFGKPGFSGDDVIHRAPIPFITPMKALSAIPRY